MDDNSQTSVSGCGCRIGTLQCSGAPWLRICQCVRPTRIARAPVLDRSSPLAISSWKVYSFTTENARP